jgi:hypothetical protein
MSPDLSYIAFNFLAYTGENNGNPWAKESGTSVASPAAVTAAVDANLGGSATTGRTPRGSIQPTLETADAISSRSTFTSLEFVEALYTKAAAQSVAPVVSGKQPDFVHTAAGSCGTQTLSNGIVLNLITSGTGAYDFCDGLGVPGNAGFTMPSRSVVIPRRPRE